MRISSIGCGKHGFAIARFHHGAVFEHQHAVRQGERYGVPAHELLLRVGQRKLIGGQEDQLIDIALEIQRERAEGKA